MAHERREYILRLLEERGRVRSAALALDLGVTDETIRTDLVLLQQKGLLRRVHGGAVHVPSSRGAHTAFSGHERRLAEAAAQELLPGGRVYLDDARLSLALAAELEDEPCELVTPSPRLLCALSPASGQRKILCPGGELSGRLLDSPSARAFFRTLSVGTAFLVPDSLSPGEVGYHDPVRAAWARMAVEQAEKVVLAVSDRCFATDAPHGFSCSPNMLLLSEEAPSAFKHFPRRLIPGAVS